MAKKPASKAAASESPRQVFRKLKTGMAGTMKCGRVFKTVFQRGRSERRGEAYGSVR